MPFLEFEFFFGAHAGRARVVPAAPRGQKGAASWRRSDRVRKKRLRLLPHRLWQRALFAL